MRMLCVIGIARDSLNTLIISNNTNMTAVVIASLIDFAMVHFD